VTGSIGVVGGKLVIREGAARLGVHTERISAGPEGGMLGPWEPFSEEQALRFAASLGRFYERFLTVVSGGRRAPMRAIEPWAQGRVWTGRQAMERGLVDSLGGLTDGLDQLAALVGRPRAALRVVHVGFPVSRLAALSQLVQGQDSVRALLAPLLAASGRSLSFARALALAPGRPLALMPWRVDGAEDA
jgi:protease-4